MIQITKTDLVNHYWNNLNDEYKEELGKKYYGSEALFPHEFEYIWLNEKCLYHYEKYSNNLTYTEIDDMILMETEQLRRTDKKYQEPFDVINSLKLKLDKLTDDQRLELFSYYCKSCGCDDPRCNCNRDE